MNKKIIEDAALICENVVKAINQRNRGNLNCHSYCPGEDALVNVLNKLTIEIKDVELECYIRLNKELKNLRTPNCVNPFSFGAVNAIVGILKMKYINVNNKKKFFISHSSSDKDIVNAFVKEILMLGCGFKYDDIFCTLDTTSIRTGDDFREEIVKNMKECDYVLLFISENYNQSDVCKNEMGAAWALGKRVLPFVLPGISFSQMGFLNVVKQGALVTDKSKLDELYNEVCSFYEIKQDWINFNKSKDSFIDFINERNKSIGKIVIG